MFQILSILCFTVLSFLVVCFAEAKKEEWREKTRIDNSSLQLAASGALVPSFVYTVH